MDVLVHILGVAPGVHVLNGGVSLLLPHGELEVLDHDAEEATQDLREAPGKALLVLDVKKCSSVAIVRDRPQQLPGCSNNIIKCT